MSNREKFLETLNDQNHWELRNITPEQREQVKEAGLAYFDKWEAAPLATVEAFTDSDMSKDEMVAHLVEYHFGGRSGYVGGHMVSRRGTKATKDDLVRYHQSFHDSEQDGPVVKFAYWNGDRPLLHIDNVIMTLDQYTPKRHEHLAVVVPENLKEAASALLGDDDRDNTPVTKAPLSATEAKVLQELVNNDFGALKSSIREFAADALLSKKQEINVEWDKKEASLPDFDQQATDAARKRDEEVTALKEAQRKAMDALRQKHEDAMKKIVDKAKAKGVTLTEGREDVIDPNGNKIGARSVFASSVEGRKQAIDAAEKENKEYLERALLTLESQRLNAQRKVLVSRVSQAATTILDGIPSAKELMVEAQQNRAAITAKA